MGASSRRQLYRKWYDQFWMDVGACMLSHRLLESLDHIVRAFLQGCHLVVERATLSVLHPFVCLLGCLFADSSR